MMSRSTLCYIPSFLETGLPVPEKKIFEGFLSYMDMAVMVTSIISTFFISLYLKAYIQNLVENGSVVSEKKQVLIFKCK